MSRVYAPPTVLRRPLPQLPARTEVDRWGRRLVVVAVAVWVAGAVVGLSISVTILTAIGFAAALAGLWRPAVGMLGIALLCTLDPLMNEYVFTGGVLRWNTFNYWLLLTIPLFPTLLLRLQNGRQDQQPKHLEQCSPGGNPAHSQR